MSDTPQPPAALSDEEKKQIDKDIQDAKSSLLSKEMQEQIDRARNEERAKVEAELATKKKLEELEAQNKALKEANERQQKEAAERLARIQSKVDEMVSSRAPVNVVNPFGGASQSADGIDALSDDQVDEIEERSAREFFGDSYDKV